MSCQKFCCFRKAQLTEESKCSAFALELFLTSHRLLKNFMEFFKFHAGKCCGINYDEVSLHGALKVVAAEMASITCGNVLKNESQRPESFHMCFCINCQDTRGLPEDVVQRVDIILTCLQRACGIENIIGQIKDVLSTLEGEMPCKASEKHRMLFLLLRELMNRVICYGHCSGEPLDISQTRMMLNLVNNFIRDWSVKRSGTSPSLKICKFCERTINGTTRQWGTFCCSDAQLFHNIWKEWSLRQSINDSRDNEVCDLEEKWKTKIGRGKYRDRSSRTYASDEKLRSGGVRDYEAGDAEFDRSVGRRSSVYREATGSSARKPEFERREDWDKEQDEFGRAKGREGLKSGRNIRKGGDDYPATADRREKRDDAQSRGKLDDIRGSSGRRDTAEDGTAVGKAAKIKSGKRSERDELLGTDSEGKKADRSKTRKKSASEATEGSRTKGGRRKKLYRNEVTDDTDDEENAADDQRRRKKARKRRDNEQDDITEVGAGRRKKKADAVDSEKKGGTPYGTDEEGKVRKRGGKRKGLSSDEGEDTESDFTKKRTNARTTSSKGQLSPDSEGLRKTETKASSKSRGQSNLYRTNGSRRVIEDDRRPIEYQLSNQYFVRLGWTVLPVTKTMCKIIQYQTIPAKPHLDWLEKHRLNGRTYYDSEKTNVLVNFLLDGSAQVFYPNGMTAIKIEKPEDRKYDMYTVFSPGGKDCMGVERKSQVVGVFDTRGNGVVFDENGTTRLSYNQIGGIWRDNPAGVPVTWKWDPDEKESITKSQFVEKSVEHLEKFLNPPKKIAIKSAQSSGSAKVTPSPSSSRKDKKVLEQKVSESESSEVEEVGSRLDIHTLVSKDPYHFKTIFFKLNNYIGLKILNRRNISLRFLAKGKLIRMELGTILNLEKQVTSYFVDSSVKHGMLTCKFEDALLCRLTRDSSIYHIAEELEAARRACRQRNFMMAKYRPFLRAWLESGTRCRPR